MSINFNIFYKTKIQCTACISSCDSDLLEYFWRADRSKTSESFYVVRNKIQNEKLIRVNLHRVILERILNRPLLKSEEVDHRDLNGLNNCRDNLRLATRSQNLANRSVFKNSKTGVKGVIMYRGKYRAQIGVDGNVLYLGDFVEIEDAKDAYKNAAIKHFGEFARFSE